MDKDKLLRLIKKYNKGFSKDDLNQLMYKGTHSVFLSIAGEPPLNKSARKDADLMQKLFLEVK